MVKDSTTTYRVNQLEDSYKTLDSKVDKIMTNHLPHIEMAILEVKTKLNVMTAINISAIILALIIQRVFF